VLESTTLSQATHHELLLEESSALDMERCLNTSGDIVAILDENLAVLSNLAHLRFSEVYSEKRMRRRLEFLLWTEQQRVRVLKNGIMESNDVAAGAMEQSAGLAIQVQRLWEEKTLLEGKVVFICI
jgi:hypothetical protein